MNKLLLLGFLFTCFYEYSTAISEYYGKFIGSLSELIDPHISGVTGQVYAVNFRTIYIKDFIFDGKSDDVYFYATRFNFPDERGFPLQDWDNDGHSLRKYNKEGVAVSLPEDTTLDDIQMIFVWNEELKVSLGDVRIPKHFDFPKPKRIEPLKGVHGIASGNILVLDMQTILIPNLYYHGGASGAKFWVSGKSARWSIHGETTSKGLTPDGQQVPDENGSIAPIGSYYGKTIILTLPDNVSVADIGSFGIWDEDFATTFASIEIPDMVNLPPSMHMLKLSSARHAKLTNTAYAERSSYAADKKVGSPDSNELSRLIENNKQAAISTRLLPPKFSPNENLDNNDSSQSERDFNSFLAPPRSNSNENVNRDRSDDSDASASISHHQNSPQSDRDFPAFLTPPKLNLNDNIGGRSGGSHTSSRLIQRTQTVNYSQAPIGSKHKNSDFDDKIYFPNEVRQIKYKPPSGSTRAVDNDSDYDYDYETDSQQSSKQSDGHIIAEHQLPIVNTEQNEYAEDTSRMIKGFIRKDPKSENDLGINSNAASLIGLRTLPSFSRSKNSADSDNGDNRTKIPQAGAVLRKIDGKWFYLVPAGDD